MPVEIELLVSAQRAAPCSDSSHEAHELDAPYTTEERPCPSSGALDQPAGLVPDALTVSRYSVTTRARTITAAALVALHICPSVVVPEIMASSAQNTSGEAQYGYDHAV